MPAKYKIVKELGVGGMGKVYKGLLIGQAGFQRPVVMKRLRDAQDPENLRLLVEEARRYAVLDHENIGNILDFENIGNELCIILEYIDGWSLGEYLEQHRALGQLPDIELSVFIVSRVCRALQYVYGKAAMVHRDVSPSNIMMTREGAVKLIDFGIATRSGTKDRYLTGKPAYMAPEVVVEMRADSRSDLFSLGAVFYEMLTLQRLFAGQTTSEVLDQVITARVPSPRRYNAAIPDGVMSILRTALQRNPDRRYASAGDMGGACEHLLYDEGYGPTNLSLKQYVQALFPGDAQASVVQLPTLDPAFLAQAQQAVAPSSAAGRQRPSEPGAVTTRRSRPQAGRKPG